MRFLVYTTLVLLQCRMYAQDKLIGLKGGVNRSDFTGEAAEGLRPKTGFHVGILTSLPLGSHFTYQPEVTFSREGNEFEDIAGLRDDFDYLNLTPVLIKYFPGKSGINLEAGFQLGILLSAKSILGNQKEDIKERYLGENASAIMGLGYEYKDAMLSIRYNLGVYSILDDDLGTKLLSSVWQCSIGFRFL